MFSWANVCFREPTCIGAWTNCQSENMDGWTRNASESKNHLQLATNFHTYVLPEPTLSCKREAVGLRNIRQ